MKRSDLYTKKPGFTMLELVLVIVVLGILASVAIPRMDRDLKQEAADNILSAIRFTQHMALNDDKQRYDSPLWQRRFWRIVFGTCTGNDHFYMIGSDDNMTGSTNATFAQSEAAIDPLSSKPYFWTNGTACTKGDPSGTVSDEIFISKKYGITTITPTGGCAGAAHIAFDNLGRPFHGANFSNSTTPDYSGYMKNQCRFTFTMSDGTTFAINIEPETGYTYIVDQNAS